MDWTCTVQELASATGGQIKSEIHREFHRLGTDTRQDLTGKLFVALKGDTHDAHDYIAQAVTQHAQVILVHQWREIWRPFLTQASFVQVDDTLQALQNLARYWRKKHKFKVLGVTGSNGKTTTKEFTYDLLKEWVPTHCSRGSYNNHWGVPLTILDADPGQKILVVEMGMNKLGEIWRLCQISEPDVVVVTSVGRAHIGELGTQAKVAQAKEEIYSAAPNAIHVFNMDNEWTLRMQSRSHATQIKFSSFRNDVDVHFRAQRLNWDGMDLIGHIKGLKGQTWVHVLGRQNTVNLMAAASLALAAEMPIEQIWQGIGSLRNSSWGRNQLLSLENGAHVLFDAYNANPDSMLALLKNLYEIDMQGRKFLVMGEMLELGALSEAAHEEIGERVGGVGFEGVWYIGAQRSPFAKGLEKSVRPKTFVTTPAFDEKVAKTFMAAFKPGDLVAVKGSRGVHLEKVVESWPLQTPLGEKP